MKTMIPCIAALLAFGILTPALEGQQSCQFNLSKVSTAGGTQLDAGDYRLVIDGMKIVLTEMKTRQSFELAGKIESSDSKFSATEIHSRQVDGVARISEIRIGGTKIRVTFD